MPRLLELFSGTKSVSRVAARLGWECVSLDICPRHSPDLCISILAFEETAWPRDAFDFVWASPPCESYSNARTTGRGADPVAREVDMRAADALVAKTKRVLEWFASAHHCVENPQTSRLWGREVSRGLRERSVLTSYCQFEGFGYRKTTRLAVSFSLELPICPGAGRCQKMIGKKHPQHAQRGGGGAEAGGKVCHTVDQLHSVPPGLVEEILKQLPPTPRETANASASGAAAS
jgi:hypothetical protein